MRSKEDIEKLKRNWCSDPCWDIEYTEGFEDHKEELLKFRLEKESEWEEQRKAEEAKIDEEAERLGVKGLYRKMLMLQAQIDSMAEIVNEIPRYR